MHNDDYYFAKDAQGNVRTILRAQLIDNGSADYARVTEVARYGYDAWGNTTITPIGNHTIDGVSVAQFNRIRWKSRYQDESGLYYMGGRYYSPITKQYLSPVNPETAMANAAVVYGLNLYLLTLTNPVNMQYNSYTIATDKELAYYPDELSDWKVFWQVTWPGFWGSWWGKGLAIGLFILVTIATLGASLVFKAAAAAIWIGYAKTMVVSAVLFAAGAAVAGLSSISMGNSFWEGFADYINKGWSQALALTSILYGVQLGLTIRQLAVAKAAAVTVSNGNGGSEPAKLIREIAHGEKLDDLFNEMKGLTATTGKEHAIVKLVDGKRVLVSGGEGGIGFENMPIKRLYFHTHPYGRSSLPSFEDISALRDLGQTRSWILANGEIVPFWR